MRGLPAFQLVRPAREHLPSHIAALERGWSPDTQRPEARFDELEKIARDPDGYLALNIDREAAGPPVKLPDGSFVARLPSIRHWMWDGEFCGSIALRWQPGTPELPPHCLGHIGYSVVPWKRRLGYATRALAMFLPAARDVGLPYVEITTDEPNIASQRVITANGGVLVERFHKPATHGGAVGLRYRIDLA
jgi:predicted acetyltransferase